MLLTTKLLTAEQVPQRALCATPAAPLETCPGGARPQDLQDHWLQTLCLLQRGTMRAWGLWHGCSLLVSVCGTAPSLLCDFAGNKVLQPLQYARIAAATFVSPKRVVRCIQATMSLFSRCIAQGRNVALILRDIGVLLIEGAQVQMKYYCDFLEVMAGKDTLKEVLLRVSVLVLHGGATPFAGWHLPAALVFGRP